MDERVTIRVGLSGKVQAWQDGEWTILYVEDGSGSVTTVSLTTHAALDLATLLRGAAVSAAFDPCDCGARTTGKWADVHAPSCPAVQSR